jgi:hypothetical protein
MTTPVELLEPESWPALRERIHQERARRVEGLLRVMNLDGLKNQQGFIEALDWVLEEAKPKPPPRDDDDD